MAFPHSSSPELLSLPSGISSGRAWSFSLVSSDSDNGFLTTPKSHTFIRELFSVQYKLVCFPLQVFNKWFSTEMTFIPQSINIPDWNQISRSVSRSYCSGFTKEGITDHFGMTLAMSVQKLTAYYKMLKDYVICQFKFIIYLHKACWPHQDYITSALPDVLMSTCYLIITLWRK